MVHLLIYGRAIKVNQPDPSLIARFPRATPNVKGHPQLLVCEVVESHAVPPIQALFKEGGAYLTETGVLPLTLGNGLQE